MSMKHHWAELDALLAEVDREARFKKGAFRPHLAPIAGESDAAENCAATAPGTAHADAPDENLILFAPPQKKERAAR